MKTLRIVVRQPGTLLSKLLDTEISQEQYAQVVMLLANPETYVVVARDMVPGLAKKNPIGFAHREAPDAQA